LALALSTAWESRRVSLSRVLATLLIVPIGTLLTAIFYCLVLFACELLAADRFAVAAGNFWIGDTLGIVTLMPAALTALDLSVRRQAPSRSELVSAFVFGSLLLAALWIIFGLRRSHEYQFFYLVFIPVVWIAVRAGYAGVSLALPVVHVLIVSIAIS
jgi:two-component system, LuxR family, sensor kinase FixL